MIKLVNILEAVNEAENLPSIADQAMKILRRTNEKGITIGAVGDGDGETYISITVDYPSGYVQDYDVFFDEKDFVYNILPRDGNVPYHRASQEAYREKQKSKNVNEANDSDKFQDDGYVDKKDVDSTSDVYTHDDPESMAFEQIEDGDEDKEPTTSQLKGGSVSNLATKLQQTTKEMKQVVKKWKNTDGSEKEKLMNRLRVLNKIKKEVEGLL